MDEEADKLLEQTEKLQAERECLEKMLRSKEQQEELETEAMIATE